MNRDQKQTFVSNMQKIFQETNSVIIAYYKGLNVSDMTELRSRFNKSEAKIRVVNNRLTKIALAETKHNGLSKYFQGPVAIAYSSDLAKLSKSAVEFSKYNNSFKIIAGATGNIIFDDVELKKIANLPSLKELRRKIVYQVQYPAQSINTIVSKTLSQIISVLKAYASDKENTKQ